MRYLLRKVAIVGTNNLEGLSQYWIEWLLKAFLAVYILGYTERRYVGQTEDGIVMLIGELEHLFVFHYLPNSLHHCQRLIEVDRNTETTKVFAYRVLEYLPN